MAKNTGKKFLDWILFLGGLLVSVAVAVAAINGSLTIPKVPGIVTVVAGWIVIVAGVIGLWHKAKKSF